MAPRLLITRHTMRIEIMLTAKDAGADTTSVSTTIDLDTQQSGWEHGLVQTVTAKASAGAERLREHLVTDEVPTTCELIAFEPATFEPATFQPMTFGRAPACFTPLATLVPAAAAGRHLQ